MFEKLANYLNVNFISLQLEQYCSMSMYRVVHDVTWDFEACPVYYKTMFCQDTFRNQY